MPAELQLSSIDLPRAHQLVEDLLGRAIELASTDVEAWPRRAGNATALGQGSIGYSYKLYVKSVLGELADLEPDSAYRLPTQRQAHAAFAGIKPDEDDYAAVVFSSAGWTIPSMAFALLVDAGVLEWPRSLALRFRACKCDPDKQWPGVWRNPPFGATYIEAVLMAEGRHRPAPGEAAAYFDRYAIPIVSLPVDQLPSESETEMLVRIQGALLDLLERSATLLATGGHAGAAAVLNRTAISADAVRYGAPEKRGALHATSAEAWLGTVHPIWELLRRRKRRAVLALLPTLQPTAPLFGDEERLPNLSNLVYGHRAGANLVRTIERFASAGRPAEAERLRRRLAAELASPAELAEANIDSTGVDWFRLQKDAIVRSSEDRQTPAPVRLLMRRGDLGAINVYAINHVPDRAALEAADSSYLHGIDPYHVCMERQARRLRLPVELGGRNVDTWIGLGAAILSSNVIFVAAARPARGLHDLR